MQLRGLFVCCFVYMAAYCAAEFVPISALVTPLEKKRILTTSVIVPCVARHFFLLSGLLESYQNQTVLPDEIVVSISEVEKLDPKSIAALDHCQWGFKLKIISNRGVIYDEPNRTIAMDNSSGQLLIFSDADDIPHPQRVELAKFVFENYDVDCLFHGLGDRKDCVRFGVNGAIRGCRFNNFNDMLAFSSAHRMPITTGSPCFLRKVADAIKWHTLATGTHWQAGGDYSFASSVYRLFKNNLVIPLPLIVYRNSLSSHGSVVRRLCKLD